MTFVMDRGTLVAFDAGTYRATVRLGGSLAAVIEGVPVSRGIASGELVAGRRVTVALLEGGGPDDAMLLGVW